MAVESISLDWKKSTEKAFFMEFYCHHTVQIHKFVYFLFHVIEFIIACLLIFVVCNYPHKTIFSDHNDGSDTF